MTPLLIGTGPGGEGTAMNLAKSGKRVAVVEKQPKVGGGCAHWGHKYLQKHCVILLVA